MNAIGFFDLYTEGTLISEEDEKLDNFPELLRFNNSLLRDGGHSSDQIGLRQAAFTCAAGKYMQCSSCTEFTVNIAHYLIFFVDSSISKYF